MLPPLAGSKPLGYDSLLATVQQLAPSWDQITLRLGGTGGGRGGPRSQEGARAEGNAAVPRNTPPAPRPNSIAQAVTFTIRESTTWPRTATTALTLDHFNGSVLRREGFGDQNLGRQIRSWTRFLHTGEALGRCGQLIACLASFGACVLVYSGFALSWRRFFGKRTTTAPRPASASA